MAHHQSLVSVTGLMARFRSGDREAADQLFSLLYPELRRLAAIKMNAEGSQHSWQPSLLVNELYLQMVKLKSLPAPGSSDHSERDHFLNFAAHVMRHLLIDHSRLLSHRITKIDIANFETLGADVHTTLQDIDELLEDSGGHSSAAAQCRRNESFRGIDGGRNREATRDRAAHSSA